MHVKEEGTSTVDLETFRGDYPSSYGTSTWEVLEAQEVSYGAMMWEVWEVCW